MGRLLRLHELAAQSRVDDVVLGDEDVRRAAEHNVRVLVVEQHGGHRRAAEGLERFEAVVAVDDRVGLVADEDRRDGGRRRVRVAHGLVQSLHERRDGFGARALVPAQSVDRQPLEGVDDLFVVFDVVHVGLVDVRLFSLKLCYENKYSATCVFLTSAEVSCGLRIVHMAKKAKKAEKAEKAEKAKAEAKDKKAATRTAMERLQEVQSILAKLELSLIHI